jgi:hypothetical protein
MLPAAFPSLLLLFVSAFAPLAFAQVDCNEGMPPIDNSADSQMSAPDFLRSVAAKESAFAKAFSGFGYTADVSIQTLQGETVDGELHQVSTVAFDPAGMRIATARGTQTNTLSRLKLSTRDIANFVLAPPFALTTDAIAERDTVYSGRQQVGEHNASVFDPLPRNDVAPLRGFAGRAWVFVGQSAVLKTCGRSSNLPIGQIRYEVERVQVAGDNWFPALIRADETMRVGGEDVHVRVTVKYADYKAR